MRFETPNIPGVGSSRSCPECAETIKSAARRCRYCGWTSEAVDLGGRRQAEEVVGHFRLTVVGLLLISGWLMALGPDKAWAPGLALSGLTLVPYAWRTIRITQRAGAAAHVAVSMAWAYVGLVVLSWGTFAWATYPGA